MRCLITGSPGSGKSALATELQRRGLAAFDADLCGVAYFADSETGRVIREGIDFSEQSDPVARANVLWLWSEERLVALLSRADEIDVFVCGIARNTNELLHLFDMVVVLALDRGTLARRVQTRTDHEYGRHPADLASLLEDHDPTGHLDWPEGVVPVDASRSIPEVADEILAHLSGGGI